MKVLSTFLLLCGLLGAGCVTMSEPGRTRTVDRENHGALDMYLNKGHIPKGNVRIIMEVYEFSTEQRDAWSLAARYRGPRISVDVGGLDVYSTRDGFTAAIEASRNRHTRSSKTRQFLLLRPSTSGRLQVLEIQREPWLVYLPTSRYPTLVTTFREEVLGSGLNVRLVRASKEGVEVELTPYFISYKKRGTRYVRELATTVILQPGVPAVVMSHQDDTANLTSTLLSRQTQKSQSEVIAVLRADIGEED